MRRVVFNQKGGVGKTTIVCNLAALSAADGRPTLLVDLDQQANATRYMLGAERVAGLNNTVSDFFEDTLAVKLFSGPAPITDYIHATPYANLAIIAADARLGELQSRLENRYKIFKLREALDELADSYAAVYIDTPPALDFYTRSALIAANRCLIPFDCDDFSRQALYALLAGVQEIKFDHNKRLEIEGIIVNQFQPRARLPQQLVAELIKEKLPVINTYISSSVKIRESHERAQPLIELAPKHKLSQEFQALYATLNRS